MSKLYIFGIGGTGSRVLKSLTMLMASGVLVNNSEGKAYEIVPIIIDPDKSAADLTQAVKLMQDYNKIHSRLDWNSGVSNQFFRNKINLSIIPSCCLALGNTDNTDFKTYIQQPLMNTIEGLPDANYALSSALFSTQNLNSSMEVGFKGNPNIGSVVLNQFQQLEEYKDFTSSFNDGDRIFIISSIFGGTGASGFPLLLKNIRNDEREGIKNAVIGAVSVLPYFDVKPDEESSIDSTTFRSKTKAALSYYDRNMSNINSLYYIGDNITKQYENSEGGITQQNDAHFIELASALAIINFARAANLETLNGKPTQSTNHYEFGIRDDYETLTFSNLDSTTNDIIKRNLIAFTLFCKFLNEQIVESLHQPWAKQSSFDENFLRSSFIQTELADFRKAYMIWLKEMSHNSRAFSPFNLDQDKKNLFGLINGVVPSNSFFSLKNNYSLFDDKLNAHQKKIKKENSQEQLFIELFYKTIDELIRIKFKM